MSRFLVLAVALIASAAAAPAWSEPLGARRVEVIKVKVPVGDLDLNSQAGADALIRRASHAAAKACGSPDVSGALVYEQLRAYRACKSRALAGAVAQSDAPVVQARYARLVGGSAVQVAEFRH
jgi:UrcA family protein